MKRKVEDYVEFNNAIQKNELVYLFGTGISAALTGKSYSWAKWIEDGVECLTDVSVRNQLRNDFRRKESAENLVNMAGKVINATKIDGVYYEWMKNEFESNPIVNETLSSTLKKMTLENDIVATTNYDLLLEEAIGVSSLSYTEPDKVVELLNSHKGNAVIHIHGIYDSKKAVDSIIADKEQYNKLLNDKGAQFIQNILGTRTLIFIGCGKTTEDVNIARFIEFAKKYLKLDRTYYYLCNSSQLVTGMPDNIKLISYGDSYDDIQGFLEDMAQVRLTAHIEKAKIVGRTIYTKTQNEIYGFNEYHYANETLKFCGRKRELGELRSFLETDDNIKWWAVTGQAGAGKSRLAYEFMHRLPAGYYSFFLNIAATARDVQDFTPFCNTLIIIDYVKGNEKNIALIITELIALFNSIMFDGTNCYHLRILLLERENITISGTWYYALEQSFKYYDRALFRSAEYYENPSATEHDFLNIEDLDQSAVVELIADICEKRGLPKDNVRDNKLRDNYADKFEKLRFRPLFIQIYIQAWIENGKSNIAYQNYEELIKAVIDKEEEHMTCVMNGDMKCTSAIIHLTTRACVSPLLIKELPNEYKSDWDIVNKHAEDVSLPGIDRRQRLKEITRDTTQAAGVRGDDKRDEVADIVPLYPDIIKEALLIRYVDDWNSFGDELWKNSPNDFSAFLYRSIMDYPDNQILRQYIRAVTADYKNIDAMYARIAVLHHEIITPDDNIEELTKIIDDEYDYWNLCPADNVKLMSVRLDGLYSCLWMFLGWTRKKEAYKAIRDVFSTPNGRTSEPASYELFSRKCRFLINIVNYFISNNSYTAAEYTLNFLSRLREQITEGHDELKHHLMVTVKSEALIVHTEKIKNQCRYNQKKWDKTLDMCDKLQNICDLTTQEDAELFAYTVCECCKIAAGKYAFNAAYDYSMILQDYVVDIAQGSGNRINDKIHYYYLYSKFIQVSFLSMLYTQKNDINSAVYCIDIYLEEIESNEMIRDFSGLLVGTLALKVVYDTSLTNIDIKKYASKADRLLEMYPDSKFMAAKYIDFIGTVAKHYFNRRATKEETQKCYVLALRFPLNGEVLDEFFTLLQNSDEYVNRKNYLKNKQIIVGLMQNQLFEYL